MQLLKEFKVDFEKKLSRLEEIVQRMEKGDSSLEDSLKLFEEGIKLSRECQSQLTKAEAQVKKLIAIDDSGKATTEPFHGEDSES
ncbi:MAG: exodeoxyribonuclease VII small subunit [Bdellovibrionales bacterium RIFCSPHIGHO2_01_FULL_40_29]|nr:MAG: exodeoxyribonuclease VII small subunit [Bdellovibrionales bacterium RIFCSPHIGHO2_01_FULL_40_29]OFZ35179.1 MAG: exodeoxyribonuclease VII small subunit [Bdellovibrionales bacterium RIFCSPHIGHO2_02_FULL_40_15]